MTYMIFKYDPISNRTVIVNDSEGIPMEWDTYDEAKAISDLFQSNTNQNCKYEVKKISNE